MALGLVACAAAIDEINRVDIKALHARDYAVQNYSEGSRGLPGTRQVYRIPNGANY